MDIDVALVPAQTDAWPARVCVMVDELRASSTITTLLDLGPAELLLTRGLAEARRLGRERGAILAGERRGVTPRGFEANNSPTELAGLPVGGRTVVLSTSNGTAVLHRLRTMPAALVGCLLDARAVAEAAVELAARHDIGLGVVCAGVAGRFALDDAIAAGVIVERALEAIGSRGGSAVLGDGAKAALRIGRSYPDLVAGLEDSATGRLVHAIGASEDIAFCARVDVSRSVGILRPGTPMRIDRLGA